MPRRSQQQRQEQPQQSQQQQSQQPNGPRRAPHGFEFLQNFFQGGGMPGGGLGGIDFEEFINLVG
jgi:hypothetical protein